MTAETLSVRIQYPQDNPISAEKTSSQDGAAIWKKAYAESRQKHWQQVFQVGDYSPYDKARKLPQGTALREALYESLTDPISFVTHIGEHIRKVDTDLRGGKDIGGAKERWERVGAFASMAVLFTAFDYATSKPFERFFPMIKNKVLTPEELRLNARMGAMKKILDVMNDKYATALGNMLVEKISGKRGFIHEVADKGADTIQSGFEETNDLVNGATLESYMRIFSQVPIVGALFEQGMTRLSLLQEKSSLHTATGKMLYMALGVFIRDNRKADKMDGASLAGLIARTIL
ncbi:MAG: hypothetical protein ACOY3M_01255 [Patescibacteria group bacterium]